MKTLQFQKQTWLPATPEEVFDWHAREDAFDNLVPPWQRFEIIERPAGLENDTRLTFRIFKGPISIRWVAEHRDVIPGRQFRDVQVEGPFAYWNHLHRFEPAENGTLLKDSIEFAPPLGFLGRMVAGPLLRRDLEKTFDFRHRVTLKALSRAA